MEKNNKHLQRFKEYFLAPLLLCVIMSVAQFGTYYFGAFINGFYKSQWWVDFLWPSVDDKIPFLVDFTIIYLLGNVWNIIILFLVNLFICRKAMYMLAALEITGFLISLIFFICIPSPSTTLVANIPPPGTGFSWWLYSTLIAPDAANDATSFPSQHFIYLISIMLTCFSFIKKKDIKVICMCILSTIVFILVGMSTFLIKQHFFVDAIASAILMATIYIIFYFTKTFPKINLFFEKIYLKIHLPSYRNVSR